MKILLAGPGTGKTHSIGKIISEHGDGKKFLVMSFTNTTVKDLQKSLNDKGITEENCMTLHKFAVKYNHDHSRHVLQEKEIEQLEFIAEGLGVEFPKICDFLKSTTFDQMIFRFVAYAKSNPLYLKEKLSQYDSLIVDEYQDFNPTEQDLIDVLINLIPNSYILGDDDQCIYDFKDASSDKIIHFHNDSTNEQVPHEHICYRCPDKVVEHATNLIKNNKKRIDKKWSKSGKQGDVLYQQLQSAEEAAAYIYEQMNKIENESIFVLSTVKFSLIPLIKLLDDNSIPYTNTLKDKIPFTLLKKLWEVRSIFGKAKYVNLVLLGYTLLPARKKFYELLKKHYDSGENYEELFNYLKNKLPLNLVDNTSDLESFISTPEYAELKTLISKSAGTTFEEKLENTLKDPNEGDDNRIKLMSIHKSKGLGADHVFIIGLNEGMLPNRKKGNDTIEAQRRVFYVGMTRAKKQLTLISYVNLEGKYVNKVSKEDFRYSHREGIYKGRASSFIAELQLS